MDNQKGDSVLTDKSTHNNNNSLVGVAIVLFSVALVLLAVGFIIWVVRQQPEPLNNQDRIDKAVQATTTAQAALAATAKPAIPFVPVFPAPPSSQSPEPTKSSEKNPFPQTAANALAQLSTKQTLVIGVRADTPPFGEDTNWKGACDPTAPMIGFAPQGIDIEFGREFALRWLKSPQKVVFKCVTVDGRIPALEKQEIDILIAAFTATADRCGKVACSVSYVDDTIRLLVAKNKLPSFTIRENAAGEKLSGYDLCNKKIAILKDTYAKVVLEADKIARCKNPIPLTVFDTRQEAIDQVELGKMDAYATDGLIIEALARKKPTVFTVLNGDYGFATSSLSIAVHRDAKGLLELVNLTLSSMSKDGWLAYHHNRYFDCQSSLPNIQLPSGVSLPAFVVRADLPPASACASAPATTYDVKPGDTPGSIARKELRDFSLWPCLLQVNNIPDEYSLYIKRIKLPTKAECDAIKKS
ncbi:MAG: transporter substrate-binding domain-containing protein [Anaerolineae bacterium]|nr:transporter substrate-binding domain-containing protein [Anaerolineae bacterium]